MDDSWLHELEMDDPFSLFPEFYTMKMCDSSSSGVEVEITKKQNESNEIEEKLYRDYQPETNDSIVFSVSNDDLLLLNGNYKNNNNDLHCQKKPASNSSSCMGSTNWMEFGRQLRGDTSRNKVTTLPLPHHIVVERKRRQDLNHRFLALSKVIPGKKKRDKASILGETVKYMKDLQERIKELEEKSKMKVVESVVFVQKSSSSTPRPYFPHNNNNNSNKNGSYCYSKSIGSYAAESNDDNFSNETSRPLPEIEAKVIERERSVLIRVHCENVSGKAILLRLLTEIPKLHLLIVTTNAVPFGNDIDITLIAQMGADFCMKTKDIVEYLRSALPNFI